MGSGSQKRRTKTSSIVMLPEEWEWVDKKVSKMGPEVMNRSHYFRILREMDERYAIIRKGEINHDIAAVITGLRDRTRSQSDR